MPDEGKENKKTLERNFSCYHPLPWPPLSKKTKSQECACVCVFCFPPPPPAPSPHSKAMGSITWALFSTRTITRFWPGFAWLWKKFSSIIAGMKSRLLFWMCNVWLWRFFFFSFRFVFVEHAHSPRKQREVEQPPIDLKKINNKNILSIPRIWRERVPAPWTLWLMPWSTI